MICPWWSRTVASTFTTLTSVEKVASSWARAKERMPHSAVAQLRIWRREYRLPAGPLRFSKKIGIGCPGLRELPHHSSTDQSAAPYCEQTYTPSETDRTLSRNRPEEDLRVQYTGEERNGRFQVLLFCTGANQANSYAHRTAAWT